MTSDPDPSRQTVRWHAFASPEALLDTVAARLVALANQDIAARSRFDIVLAGGDTPRQLYSRLKQAATPWAHWHIWFGDERCLPAGDPGRNDSMARAAWLDHVPIPPAQVHPLEEADRYRAQLAAVPLFDLVLLGLGEDGHTASLFPGQDWGDAPGSPAVLPVSGAPKPPPKRLTLSAARLSASREAWFLVRGPGKAAALQRWQAGDRLPCTAICPAGGVDVFHA